MNIIGNIYRHYKGGEYKVTDVVIDENTGTPYVIYKSKETGVTYGRLLSEFTAIVNSTTNKRVKLYRFTLISTPFKQMMDDFDKKVKEAFKQDQDRLREEAGQLEGITRVTNTKEQQEKLSQIRDIIRGVDVDIDKPEHESYAKTWLGQQEDKLKNEWIQNNEITIGEALKRMQKAGIDTSNLHGRQDVIAAYDKFVKDKNNGTTIS